MKSHTPSNRRRRFVEILPTRISLRWFLTFFLLIGVGIGWYSNRVIKQKRGVALFVGLKEESRAAGLNYNYQIGNSKADIPYWPWVVQLFGIDSLCTVERIHAVLGENSDLLTYFPRLKTVKLVQPSHDDLKYLSSCPSLEVLTLQYPENSLDWSPIFELKNLKLFSVFGGEWDDDDIAKLKKSLPECEILFGLKGAKDNLFQGKLY